MWDYRLDPPEQKCCSREDCTYNDQDGHCELLYPARGHNGCEDYREACPTCGEPLRDGYCESCDAEDWDDTEARA